MPPRAQTADETAVETDAHDSGDGADSSAPPKADTRPAASSSSRRPRLVSLYSGAGGLDLGFMRAGCVPVIAVDNDSHAVAAHNLSVAGWARRMPWLRCAVRTTETRRGPAICRDAEDFLAGIDAAGPAELLIGGPPCQGFSVAGRQNPDDPRSRHVHLFVEAAARLQPDMFVMENVAGLAERSRWQPTLDTLRSVAARAGYDTSVWVLDAADHRTPQRRRRMFLIGARRPGRLPRPPAAEPSQPVTVRDALSCLPAWGRHGNDTHCRARVVPARNPILRRSPYAGMMFNGTGRPLDLDAPASTLPASMGGNRTPIIDQHALDGRDADWAETYHAHLAAGGVPRRAAPDRLRRLTLEEAAALQGFPADTRWSGPLSARWRQIGNSVPPPLAEAVARAVTGALPAGQRPPADVRAPCCDKDTA